MFCDDCENSEALSDHTGISGDKQNESYFCINCSKNMQTIQGRNILYAIESDEKTENNINSKCPNCGLTAKDLIYEGRPGCPVCYKYFNSFFISFYEGNKNKKYNGKKPFNYVEVPTERNNIYELNQIIFNSLDKKSKLEKALKTAVMEERYEDAAVIRDKLKEVTSDE